MGKIYQVKVFGISGEMKIVDLCSAEEDMKRMTVQQLRKKVEERFSDIAGEDDLQMIFTNKRLVDDVALLSSYGIQHLSVIQLVVKVPGGLIV